MNRWTQNSSKWMLWLCKITILKMISLDVFEGWYNTGQKFHQIWADWLCILAWISKTANDIILKIVIPHKTRASIYLNLSLVHWGHLSYWDHHCNEGCDGAQKIPLCFQLTIFPLGGRGVPWGHTVEVIVQPLVRIFFFRYFFNF